MKKNIMLIGSVALSVAMSGSALADTMQKAYKPPNPLGYGFRVFIPKESCDTVTDEQGKPAKLVRYNTSYFWQHPVYKYNWMLEGNYTDGTNHTYTCSNTNKYLKFEVYSVFYHAKSLLYQEVNKGPTYFSLQVKLFVESDGANEHDHEYKINKKRVDYKYEGIKKKYVRSQDDSKGYTFTMGYLHGNNTTSEVGDTLTTNIRFTFEDSLNNPQSIELKLKKSN